MKKREPVSHIMTQQVITLNHTNNLHDAERMFKENNIRHIPVVSGTRLIGMLSYTDLLRISFVESVGVSDDSTDTAIYDMLSIEQVMVSNPETVSTETTIKEVAEILSKREFHALPVVDNGELKGIVTTTDLINFLLDQY
ncbi:MAG: CBS domain-containing protein [Bacteroidetes bacterium]|nr:CBS domain-containing protein [Bacteroidota bacterium]